MFIYPRVYKKTRFSLRNALLTTDQSSHPLYIPLTPLLLHSPPKSRQPNKPCRYKPNPRHLPFQTTIHFPPRHPHALCRRRQRRRLHHHSSRLRHKIPSKRRLGNHEKYRLRHLAHPCSCRREKRPQDLQQRRLKSNPSRHRLRQPLHCLSHAQRF